VVAIAMCHRLGDERDTMRAPNESKTGSNGMATGYKGQEYLVRKLFGRGRPNAPPINSPFPGTRCFPMTYTHKPQVNVPLKHNAFLPKLQTSVSGDSSITLPPMSIRASKLELCGEALGKPHPSSRPSRKRCSSWLSGTCHEP
jgi:hypothetical protein